VGFESFHDPNMIKTAPKRQNRNPAAFGDETDYSDETEGSFCYDETDCGKEEKKTDALFFFF
jgi:hypothetical protein